MEAQSFIGFNDTDFRENCMSLIIRSNGFKFLFTMEKDKNIEHGLFVRLLAYKGIKSFKQLYSK